MEAKSRLSLTLLGALAPIVWGSTYIVTTELLPAGHPMTAATLRALPAGLLLILITRARPRQWGRLLILSALNIGAFFPLLFIAAYRLPGGLAAVVGAAQPFIVALAVWAFFRRRTPSRQLGWAAVAVFGVTLAMVTGTTTLDLVGVVAALAGTASMAIGITLTRAWGPTDGLTGLASTGWQLLLGGLMIAPLIPLFDRGPFVLTSAAVVGYLWLSVVGGAFAYAVWFHAARRLPATSVSLLGVLSPITAALLGWAILGQALGGLQIIGFALALTASVLGQRMPRQEPGARTTTATPAGRHPAHPPLPQRPGTPPTRKDAA